MKKKRLVIYKSWYDTAKELIQTKCNRDAVLEFMNIFNVDYDKANWIINAVRYDYKYMEVVD